MRTEASRQGRRRARELGRYAGYAAFLVLFWSFVVGLIASKSLVVPEANPASPSCSTYCAPTSQFSLLSEHALAFSASPAEVEDGSKPWVRWICDAVVAVFIGLNVSAVGFAIGQLGGEGLIRILPHAWLEVPAFALGIWGYLLARSDALDRRAAFRVFGLAFALLVLAAPIEAFISGGIR